MRAVRCIHSSGSGEPAAPRRQSLLRSQARCALLPAATPRMMGLRQARISRRLVGLAVPVPSAETALMWVAVRELRRPLLSSDAAHDGRFGRRNACHEKLA